MLYKAYGSTARQADSLTGRKNFHSCFNYFDNLLSFNELIRSISNITYCTASALKVSSTGNLHMWSPEQLHPALGPVLWGPCFLQGKSNSGLKNHHRSDKTTPDSHSVFGEDKISWKTGVFLLCSLTGDPRPSVVPLLMMYFTRNLRYSQKKNHTVVLWLIRHCCRVSHLLRRWRQYAPPKPDRLHGVITHSTCWTLGCIWPQIAHLRQECQNSKFVIFQEKILKGSKSYNFM